LSALDLGQSRCSDHIRAMTANAKTQFSLFDQPPSLAERPASRQKRRMHLPDLVQDVSQLGNEDLIDLIRAALGEVRRRGIGQGSAMDDGNPAMAPVIEQTRPVTARIIRKAAPLPEVPPAKASMVRAAVRAGFSPARVARDFGVSTATVRKLMAP
jgi:DNA-directed RNA polymerase specialized sigma24 family protein